MIIDHVLLNKATVVVCHQDNDLVLIPPPHYFHQQQHQLLQCHLHIITIITAVTDKTLV
jgi:hypothetical protein